MENDGIESSGNSESIAGIAFSPKEMLVIHELVVGESYKVIAAKLSMSERNVQYHVKNIMNKVRCNSKSALMAFFNANGIFPDDELYVQKLSSGRYLRKIAAFLLGGIIVAVASFYVYNKNKSVTVMDLPEFHENFLKRVKLLSKINEILKSQNGIRMVVIAGSGGVGKTTLGREVLSSSKCSVKWEINAETSDSLYNSFFDLASQLAIENESQKELEIIKDIMDAEEKRKRLVKLTSTLLKEVGNWRLLFDNVESMKGINQYLPHNSEYWGNGSIIITTRNENIQNVNSIDSSWIVNVGLLADEEQQKLFCDILYKSEFKELDKNLQAKIRKFLRNIPKMPLDVCAAAYYLKNTKISLDDYEKIVETSYRDLNEAQKTLLEENVNYSRTRYSIISSVFEEILKGNPKFKSQLLFMCLLDSQDIPKSLLKIFSDSISADKFIYDLRKNSLISDATDVFSIHRSSQRIGLDYILGILTSEEKKQMLKDLISILTPYEKLEAISCNSVKLIPHLEAFLNKLSFVGAQDFSIEKNQIDLLLTVGNILRYKAYRIKDSLDFFQKALELNKTCKYLDQMTIALVNLKIGEIYTLMSENNQAMSYLEKSLNSLQDRPMNLARAYRLIGIIHMRNDHFDEANKYFVLANVTLTASTAPSEIVVAPLAFPHIETAQTPKIALTHVSEDGEAVNACVADASDTLADMAFNYLMNGINRNDASKSVEIMKKAIDVLLSAKVDSNSKSYGKIQSRLAVHMSRLAGIYNALGKYDLALKTAQEAEDIIQKSLAANSDIIYAQGIIARERGLSYLRLNKEKEAYNYFMEAKKIFSRASVGDYLFRLKMHEAEALVRLNRLDEAFQACEAMFSTKNRERNNYCDLFFNTCYYHAAVIKYRQNDIHSAREYFKNFFASMLALCKNILSKEKYDELLRQNAFEKNPSDIKTCFENSLKIFEAIYWKDYEFIKYYIQPAVGSV
ncbi:hypothetical protein FACS1894122_08090 [Alphaproteobacteria bacterium]|nr:hypothetical protein FACS1894122_08090 [Alphaproteobacteria bacterium]